MCIGKGVRNGEYKGKHSCVGVPVEQGFEEKKKKAQQHKTKDIM